MKNRQKVFDKISLLIDAMNLEVLGYLGIKFEKREAYAVDYVSELLTMYKKKQLDWMKLLSFPDVVIEKAFNKNNTKNCMNIWNV